MMQNQSEDAVFDGVFGARKESNASCGGPVTTRIKSSLMGTSARQKLLQYKLAAQHANADTNGAEKAKIVNQVAQLQKTDRSSEPNFGQYVDHMKDIQVAI